jgi:transposase-like protein
MAVERLNHCENIVELAKELGISRRLLYGWREKLEALDYSGAPPANAREATLRNEVSRLKRVLAEKVLEVDFFKGALQQVEARHQQSGKAGALASTPRSGS